MYLINIRKSKIYLYFLTFNLNFYKDLLYLIKLFFGKLTNINKIINNGKLECSEM